MTMVWEGECNWATTDTDILPQCFLLTSPGPSAMAHTVKGGNSHPQSPGTWTIKQAEGLWRFIFIYTARNTFPGGDGIKRSALHSVCWLSGSPTEMVGADRPLWEVIFPDRRLLAKSCHDKSPWPPWSVLLQSILLVWRFHWGTGKELEQPQSSSWTTSYVHIHHNTWESKLAEGFFIPFPQTCKYQSMKSKTFHTESDSKEL